MSALRAVAILFGVAACHAGPPAPTTSAPCAPSTHVEVSIEFDPPLPAPGTLVAVHESGLVVTVAARPSGAELSLPLGPASLRLDCEAGQRELAIRVAAGMPPVVWAWRGAHATMAR